MEVDTKMAKKKIKIEYIILLALVGVGILYFLFTSGVFGPQKDIGADDLLTVSLYSAEDTLIFSKDEDLFSIVDSHDNVSYAIFKVKTKNVGDIPYTASIVDADPAALYSAFGLPLTSQKVNPDGEGSWTSTKVNMASFGTANVDFSVSVLISFENGQKVYKNGTLTLNVNGSVSGGGGGGGGGGGAGTSLCDGVTCDPYCSTVHRMYNGVCKVVEINTNDVITQAAKCFYMNATWYSPECGWDTAVDIICGDSFCHSTECCYVSDPTSWPECKSGVAHCELDEGGSIIGNVCNQDCMQPAFAVKYIIPPIELGSG